MTKNQKPVKKAVKNGYKDPADYAFEMERKGTSALTSLATNTAHRFFQEILSKAQRLLMQ